MSQACPESAEKRTREAAILSKAAVRAADRLRVSQKDLASILGISPASVSRLCSGDRLLSANDSEGQRAVLFLRIYRSLDSLLGGEQEKVAAWFRAENKHLGGVPAELLKGVRGLVHVADYLDAMRGTY